MTQDIKIATFPPSQIDLSSQYNIQILSVKKLEYLSICWWVLGCLEEIWWQYISNSKK